MSSPIQPQEEQIITEKSDAKKPKNKAKYELSEYLIKGAYIDAKDTTGKWCVAQVVERDDSDDTIKLNFDGWSHKWDEWAKFTSSKISPFRKYSQGYTGQQRYAIRDWKYSLEEVEEASKRIDGYLSKGLLNSFKSCHEITQTLRGSEYIFLDALLQNEYRNPKEEFPTSVEYFVKHFRLYIHLLKMIPEFLPEYSEGVTNLDAFLTNERVAVIHSFYEISDSVNKILGSCQRCWSNLSAYDRKDIPIKASKGREYAGKDYETVYFGRKNEDENPLYHPEDVTKHSNFIVELINAFGELGGFDEWLRVFTYTAQDPKTSEQTVLPFKLMTIMLSNITAIYHYLNKDVIATLVPKIKNAISLRFKVISNRDIKDLDKELAMKFLQKAQELLCQYYKAQEIYEFLEVSELELAFKFLTCQYLEKRLKGINEIKEISEKIDVHEHFARTGNTQVLLTSTKCTKYLNAKLFIKWLMDNKFFELILGDSIHIEIIKRCSDILKFIAKYETIPIEIIDLLWSACEGKHEAILRALFGTIIDISSSLTKEGANRLHTKILAIPQEELNEIHLNLIKGFALFTLPLDEEYTDQSSDSTADSDMSSKDPSKEVNEKNFFCVPLLWNLIQDSSQVNSHLAELALHALSAILKEKPCQKLKRLYLYKALENVKKHESASQSLTLVYAILKDSYYDTQFEYENSIKSILKELDKKFGLLELLVSEIESYHARAKKALEGNKDYSKANSALREVALVGKYSYHINQANHLEFLEFLITYENYNLNLTEKLIERLWDVYVVDSLFDSDETLYLKWISPRYDAKTGETSFILPKKESQTFFTNILSNKNKLNPENLSPAGFACFSSYFKVINELEGRIKASKNSNFRVCDLNYIGKQQLWDLFLTCRNKETLELIVRLIVDCHLRLDDSLQAQKGVLWEELVSKCMGYLKEGNSSKNELLINRGVLLLMKFFDKFEGKSDNNTKAPEESRYSNYSFNIMVILKPANTPKTVQMSLNQSLGTLRKKIAEAFGFNLNEFKLFGRGSIIDREDDETLISQYGFSGPYSIQKIQPLAGQEGGVPHPKNIVASNPEYIDLIFALLSSDNSETVKLIWDVLMRLPTNESIKRKIYKMEESWENTFDQKNIYRMLYCLHIVEDFIYDREKERSNPSDFGTNPTIEFKDREWTIGFIEKGGLKYLLSCVAAGLSVKAHHSLMATATLLKVICYLQTECSLEQLYGGDLDSVAVQLASTLLDTIYNVCEYSLAREKLEQDSSKFDSTTINIGSSSIPATHYYEGEAILYAQNLFLCVVFSNPELVELLYAFENLNKLLSVGLIESNNHLLKEKLSSGLLSLFTKFSESDLPHKPHQFFIPILLQSILDKALLKEERSDVFFKLISNTISTLDIGDMSKESLDVDGLLDKFTNFVEKRKPVEKSAKENDNVLVGILQVLRALFQKFPEKAKYYGQDRGLVRNLLHDCLFEMQKHSDTSVVPPPKCKSYNSRNAAFKLLLALALTSNDNLHEILQFITPIHIEGQWRTKRYLDWNITAKENEKSLTGYVGIKNLGCICYMNSQMQQLYMIPGFRKAIMEVDDLQYTSTPKEDNILYQLKCIFYGLANSEKQYINPKGFCQAFKDWDGNPTNVFEQMDAEEFFNIFMDRLENLTKGTKESNFIKDTFGGVLSNELIAEADGKQLYGEREEPFLTIGLQVKNKKSIEQSLKAFVEGEMLEGENACMWEEINKKVNTLRRACLKRLPNYLIFMLKRFEFDYDTMQRHKINDYFEFPNRLNLEPYTQQGLRKAELAKKKAKQGDKQDEDAKKEESIPDELPPEYFDYKLTGIVIHLGTADSGHYYSLIQNRDADPSIPEEKRWIEFNDTLVTPFDPKDIPNEAFGGEEKWKYYSAAGDSATSMHGKIKNAYILFYERVTPIKESDLKKATVEKTEESKESKETEKETKVVKGESSDKKIIKDTETPKEQITTPKHAIPEDFLQQLNENNNKFHVHKHIFSREYFDFVTELTFQRDLAHNLETLKNFSDLKNQLAPNDLAAYETLKTGIVFFLTSVVRDKQRSNIAPFLPKLKQALAQYVPACQWLIHNFTNKRIITEFFLDNPVGDMRKFIVGLIAAAFSTLYEGEIKSNPKRLYERDPKSGSPTTVTANFINCLISLTFDAKYNTRDYSDFFKLIYLMTRTSPEVAGYFIKHRYIGRLLDFFFEKASPHNQLFRDMSDVPFTENEKPPIGVMAEEKVKIRTALDELLARRKGRQFNESYGSHRTYLWQALCYLVRHCRFSKADTKRSPWQIGELDLDVTSEEKALLNPEAYFILRVLEDSHSKVAMRNSSLLYAYLCYEDSKFTENFHEGIKKGMDKEVSELRVYFKALFQLLSLEDSLSNQRCNKLCEHYCKQAKDNINYYLETDAFTSFALKIASRIERVRQWFMANNDQWYWMLQWLQTHTSPPAGILQTGLKINRRRLDLAEIQAHNLIKAQKFNALLEKKLESSKDQWDSDDDLSEAELEVGQKIDYLDLSKNKWVSVSVHRLLEEMINISLNGESMWIARDDELLAPSDTMRARQETLIKQSKEQALQAKQKNSQADSDSD